MGRKLDQPADAEIFQFEQSEALLRKVMENAAAGMALISLQRRLLYVNGAFAEMLGYEARDCLGLEIEAIIHPDCDAALALQLARLITGKQSAPFGRDLAAASRASAAGDQKAEAS